MKTTLFKYTNDVSSILCMSIFLDALKIQFPSFAQFYENSLYFTDDTLDVEVQLFIDTFDCATGENTVLNNFPVPADVIKRNTDPTLTENPTTTGVVWINNTTGDAFVCTNNTLDANVWVGIKTGRIIRPVPQADKFDFFDDNSIMLFSFLNSNASDVGGLYPGTPDNIEWVPSFDYKVPSSVYNGTIHFNKLPIDNTTAEITVSSWVKWNGNNSTMPYGWKSMDLWCESGNLGFNTFRGDLTGISFKDYKDTWVYLTVVFKKGIPGDIYFNGSKQVLSSIRGTFGAASAVMDSTFCLFGVSNSTGYRKFGLISRLRVFDRALLESEVLELATAEIDMINYVEGK